MSISDYKAALINIIDSTNDEALLKEWKTRLEEEYKSYRQNRTDETGTASTTKTTPDENTGKDDTSGYVVLESGLGIDE